MLSIPLIFLTVVTICVKADSRSSDIAMDNGCPVEPALKIRNCTDASGNKISTPEFEILPSNSSCIFEVDGQIVNAICHEGISIIFHPSVSLVRIRRQAYTMVGAAVGSPFGPIGAAVGAGIGFIGDIICMFMCGSSDPPPPPNQPPKIETPAVLMSPKTTPIKAKDGKSTAKVQWQIPKITDPEDGELDVETYPNFKNGGEFSEGTTVVYFKGTDTGGLSVTGFLTFEVKVERCAFPRWPENGNIDCDGATDIILGTTCMISCYQGYRLDEGAVQTLTCITNGAWSPGHIPDCKPRDCAKEPSISHGNIQCLHNRKVYGNMCEAVCDDGYQVRGMRMMGCDKEGLWGTPPRCKDVLPPRFNGDCPGDMQVYIDSTDNTAAVSWVPPEGKDNSGENVTITELHGYQPGQRLKAGSYIIKYKIEDNEGNIGDSCVFTVEVLTISCHPPNLQVSGGDHLKYDCPDSYNIGAVCNLGCKSGYPMGGATTIQCLKEPNVHPPTLDWKWTEDALAPFCKETNCSRAALNEPVNGALSCSGWTHGQMCSMQCNEHYDIPNIGDGMFVCGRSTGKWKPPGKVPDCNTKIDVNNMHLPNEFYYYTNKCNSSEENLNQIKNNFVNALNQSKFSEDCVGVAECKAKYVDVTCGPVSSRRKREIPLHLSRRSASQFAFVVHFDLVIPYKSEDGKSPDDIFAENEDLLYKMSDVIQKEADSGNFDLHVGDLQVESDSYGPGTPSMQCPTGTIPRQESASCVGCPKGQFATKAGRCYECHVGTYQNSTNSMDCEPCPRNTNTTDTGSDNINQCLEYCSAGEFSPNTLAPCTKCPSNSYQPDARSSSCIACGNNKRTSKNGATAKSQCKNYDLQINSGGAKVESKASRDVITVFMWLYISPSNQENVFEITDSTTHPGISLKFGPSVIVAQSGNEFNTRQSIPLSTWTAIAFSVDKPSNELVLYIGGKSVYKNSSFVISRNRVIDSSDFILLSGDMKVSAFYLLTRKASQSEVMSWSSTCIPAITSALVSTEDFAETGNATVGIPSVCDAVNECDSSPCGTHQCINKLGDYECLCSGGFTGRQCQIPPDFCKDNNCKNGATCVNGTANYTCQCTYGYSGALCEIKAVDGQWSGWTNWTMCSKSCGGGVTIKTRRCDSPPPDPEGNNCTGSSTESKPCKEEKCPECSRLRRSYGAVVTCNETSELQRCTITCRAGLYFTNPPLPYYECGVATGYKWNHVNEKNPTGRLPSCSELQPPVAIGVDFEGRYDSIPCTAEGKNAVKAALKAKMTILDCKKTGSCETVVQDPICTDAKKRRATGSALIVTVGFHANVNGKAGSLNVGGLLQNKSAPSIELLDLVKQTLELEKTAQKLMNNSVNFFQVTIDGRQHSINPGATPVTFKSTVRCPAGTVRIDVFCAECPVGSYSDGITVTMCPRGQYQDMKGQATCKQCPSGKTTAGIGSIHVSECSEISSIPSGDESNLNNGPDDANTAVKIGVGVSVSISLLTLAIVAVILLYKKIKKKQTVGDSSLDLHTPGYFHMPSKPVFEKRAL